MCFRVLSHLTWDIFSIIWESCFWRKQRTYYSFYHQNNFSVVEHSVCFPLIILKIYWLKHTSHMTIRGRRMMSFNVCKHTATVCTLLVHLFFASRFVTFLFSTLLVHFFHLFVLLFRSEKWIINNVTCW